MSLRWGRILIAAVLGEIAAIVLLIVLVAVLGPKEPAAARAYAESLGELVGPIGGALASFLGGWWAARGLTARHVLQGALVGIVMAAIDIALLVAGGAPFRLLFVGSNLGRILMGILGGWVAGRGAKVPTLR